MALGATANAAALDTDQALPKNLTAQVCDDEAEWPPFIYYQRTNGVKSQKIIGSALATLEQILTKADIDYTIMLMPWKRCLLEITNGQRYQVTLNLSFSADRERDFLLSRSYYRLTNQYFYSRKQHPNGLSIKGLSDLKHYRVCGLLGYNYSIYGLTEEEMDLSGYGFAKMIAKLHLGRCDLFVQKPEIMRGFGKVDPEMALLLADSNLVGATLPGIKDTGFHMGVSRSAPYGKALLKLLNEGIDELEASGELQKIMGLSSGKAAKLHKKLN